MTECGRPRRSEAGRARRPAGQRGGASDLAARDGDGLPGNSLRARPAEPERRGRHLRGLEQPALRGHRLKPGASGGNQAELMQQAFQTALANMRELAEMAGKSQKQAMEVVGKRVQENIEDAKKLMQPKS